MKGVVASAFAALLSMVFCAASAQELRGTLRADDVWGFVVIACYFDPVIEDCDVERSDVQAVAQTGDSAAYSFAGLQPGYYLVIAWKDTDGDGEMDLDGEDEVAFHMDAAGDPLLVTPPSLGVDLVTDSYAARAAGVGATTIVGTLYAPEVNGFSIIACAIDAVAQDCDTSRVVTHEIAHGGVSAAFRLELPDASDYLLIAWQDVNANGALEEGGPDLIAYWRDAAGEIAFVSPPADDLVLRVGAAASPVSPGAIVGTWSSAHGSAVAYFDAATGSYMPATGSGVEFTFNSDGTYERFGLISNSFFSTNNTILVYEKGAYRFDGSTLRLEGLSDTTYYRNGVFDRETKGVAMEWEYAFAFIDVDTVLFNESSTLSRVR